MLDLLQIELKHKSCKIWRSSIAFRYQSNTRKHQIQCTAYQQYEHRFPWMFHAFFFQLSDDKWVRLSKGPSSECFDENEYSRLAARISKVQHHQYLRQHGDILVHPAAHVSVCQRNQTKSNSAKNASTNRSSQAHVEYANHHTDMPLGSSMAIKTSWIQLIDQIWSSYSFIVALSYC